MLSKIICIVVLLTCPSVLGYGLGDDESSEYRGEDGDDGYRIYHQDNHEVTHPVRVRRLQVKPKIKTLSPLEIQQVKGAIQQILGHNQGNPFTPLPRTQASNEKRRSEPRAVHKLRRAPTQENYRFAPITKFTEDTDEPSSSPATDNIGTTNELPSTDNTLKTSTLALDDEYNIQSNDFINATTDSLSSLPVIPSPNLITDISEVTDEITSDKDTTKTTEMIVYESETNTDLTSANINLLPLTTLPLIGRTDNPDTNTGETKIPEITPAVDAEAQPNEEEESKMPQITAAADAEVTSNEEQSKMPQITAAVDAEVTSNEEQSKMPQITAGADNEATSNEKEPADSNENTMSPITKSKKKGKKTTKKKEEEEEESEEEDDDETTTKRRRKKTGKSSVLTRTKPKRRTTTTTTTTTRTTTTRFKLDVPALLAIIANLTYDYEVNLTAKLNQTLMKYSVPTCESPTTTVKRGLFIDYDANATGTIVAKCFVCGLENYGIPRDAHCGDAFAGDFLPLMPVDMTARGRISKFRKYCRYADVPGMLKNMSQPRSVFGRWSGGCSVRWIDLSNVYTQRSCRSRERAIMGKNFASKRMAKLEMALKHVDNGCITSPMATLVPLSRGISLYARFHACVCTGSWCNTGDLRIPWTGAVTLTIILVYITSYYEFWND